MHPSQVLDLKADMILRSGNPAWKEIMELQISGNVSSVNTNGEPSDLERAQRGARIIAERFHDEISQAHCYYVAPEMSDIIAWAAAKFEGVDIFRMDEVPTERGFAYFEKPLKMTDARGDLLLLNAVVWFRAEAQREGDRYPIVTLVAFNDQTESPDDIALQLLEKEVTTDATGRWGLIAMQGLSDQMRVGPPTLWIDQQKIDEIEAAGDTPHEFTNIVRLMHAYWLMLNQTVADVSEAEIPRAFSKRARRMNIPDRVTVVALRRTESHGHGDTDVDWQYRWMVRGHWRWQHVSKDHPLAEPDPDGGYRARVWVRPHIKGPEDRPLHLTEKVYALIR